MYPKSRSDQSDSRAQSTHIYSSYSSKLMLGCPRCHNKSILPSVVWMNPSRIIRVLAASLLVWSQLIVGWTSDPVPAPLMPIEPHERVNDVMKHESHCVVKNADHRATKSMLGSSFWCWMHCLLGTLLSIYMHRGRNLKGRQIQPLTSGNFVRVSALTGNFLELHLFQISKQSMSAVPAVLFSNCHSTVHTVEPKEVDSCEGAWILNDATFLLCCKQ